jgi:hypothetical protein
MGHKNGITGDIMGIYGMYGMQVLAVKYHQVQRNRVIPIRGIHGGDRGI